MYNVVFMHVFQPVTHLSDIVNNLSFRHLVVISCNSVKQLATRQTVKVSGFFLIILYYTVRASTRFDGLITWDIESRGGGKTT